MTANPAASKPDAPALNAYADTTQPNCAGEICNSGMRMAPSGESTMKSNTIVNCRIDKMAIINI